ncbi:MAG: NAD-dependent protein deacetylase [Gammaproteobacteria bacterium]|nr:NAD-dependent protein deacetylase [Gammaproteobacteria bacterium]
MHEHPSHSLPDTGAHADTAKRADEFTADLDRLCRFVEQHRSLFVLTGAGCSTGVGIPDYRDRDGEWKREEPVHLQAFVSDASARQRYWARSLFGWPFFARAAPGPAHVGLARLERAGWVNQLVTQNVDGLHQAAGHRNVVDLHGRLDHVTCMSCQYTFPRAALQSQLVRLNPQLEDAQATPAPDGDADLDEVDYARIVVPACRRCGGILKPDVVFFGDSVPRERVAKVREALDSSPGVLIIGSSLMVYSGFRFCRQAAERGTPMAAVNIGRTRADDLLSLKIEQDCDAVVHALSAALCGP